jgi:hypothetical protein
MDRAAVPEASIDENRQPGGREDDVSPAFHAWIWTSILEEAQPASMERRAQGSLRPGV